MNACTKPSRLAALANRLWPQRRPALAGAGRDLPWTNGNGGVTRFATDLQAQAEKSAPWNQWQLVLVEVDNKLPMYLQNHGKPFYYVSAAQDFPRQGNSAAFMAWLENQRPGL